jgi:tripeptide aminopeptidase
MPLFPRATTSRSARLDFATAQKTIAALAGSSKVHEAFEWFRSHEREIATFQLEITSVGAAPFGEERRSRFFAEALEVLGYTVERDAVGNVLTFADSVSKAEPALAISAHLDTVFPADTRLDVRREHTRLLGPGISDNGAGLAAVWALAAVIKDCGLRMSRPVVLMGNVGEEGDGNLRGMRHLFAQERWRDGISALLVVDGAGVDSIVAEALGSRRFEVTISGPGGHSWSDFGVPNPIVALARAIDLVSELPLPSSPKSTINVGTIEGGTSVNTIPEVASMRVDVRSSDPLELDRLEHALHDCVSRAVTDTQAPRSVHKHLKFKIRVVGDRPAAELRLDAPILHAVRAADAQLGIKSRIHRASTDANIPLSLGIDALAIGAGGSGGGAHTLHEWFEPLGRDTGLKRILLATLVLAGFKESGIKE